MLKETITYVDYDGVERTEDFYFNLTKAEIAKLDFTTPGGLVAKIQMITKCQDVPKLYELFENLIALSYGKKSDDGRRLMKSEDILLEFKETEAYSQFVISLLQDVEKATAFVKGIIPGDLPNDTNAVKEAKNEANVVSIQ